MGDHPIRRKVPEDEFLKGIRPPARDGRLALAMRRVIAEWSGIDPEYLGPGESTIGLHQKMKSGGARGWDETGFLIKLEDYLGTGIDTKVRLPPFVPQRFLFWPKEGPEDLGAWIGSAAEILEFYPGLSHLCGAYLHQDCELDGETWEDAVRKFIEQSANFNLLTTLSDIDHLLSVAKNDDEIWAILDKKARVDIDVRADGWSLEEWLKWIRAAIRDELKRREEAGIPINEWEQADPVDEGQGRGTSGG